MISIKLSERMLAIENMVPCGDRIADIGTDHGFIPADLLLQGICPFAIMTDINPGPLEKCKSNIEMLGIEPNLYSIRLGSGFEPIEEGEISTAIIAGMGGELIISIFEDAAYDLDFLNRVILQPRTHGDELRTFLTESGFAICDYKLARERGRICEVFAVEPCNAGEFSPDSGLVSRFLLEKGDELLTEFVDTKISAANTVLDSLKRAKAADDEKTLWNAIVSQLEEIRSNL